MQDHFTTDSGELDPLPCNTGVHRTFSSLSGGGGTPPWRLDWLRLSFPDRYVESLISDLGRAGFSTIRDRPRHGFQSAVGFVADILSTAPDFRLWYGGESQNGRALVDVPAGHANAVYEVCRRSEIPFALNRVDLCLDFDGVPFLGLQDAMMHVWESSWPFKGTKPKPFKIDDMNQGTGSTLYFGRKSGECMTRLYEKGKQLRDPLRPDWVRFEVEIKPDGEFKRAVSWAHLKAGKFHDLACAGFSAAFIPAIWECAASRVFITEPKSSRDFEDRVIAMLRQYGGLIGEIRQRAGGDWDEFGEILKAGFDAITRAKTVASRESDTSDIPY